MAAKLLKRLIKLYLVGFGISAIAGAVYGYLYMKTSKKFIEVDMKKRGEEDEAFYG